jgi:methionyl-tRNA formyltransferase
MEIKNKECIIIATVKSWNIANATLLKKNSNFEIIIITKKEKLEFSYIKSLNPKYIFFPHWSWIIPKDIYDNFTCIVFHMTDLPYGRGGSPLQNLILNGKYDTKISALKVSEEIDSGDIYLKEVINISTGSAEEILMSVSNIIFKKMIPYILLNNPLPAKQTGEIISFKRRTPKESNIETRSFENIIGIYDFIRMLDGEGYPKAFLQIGEFKFIFSDIQKKDGKLIGRVEIEHNK